MRDLWAGGAASVRWSWKRGGCRQAWDMGTVTGELGTCDCSSRVVPSHEEGL